MIKMEHIYQRFFLKVLLWIMIIPAILISQDPPEEFQFSQSTLQAFYFFENVTLDGTLIESDDWVGVFKGDICVGARQWDISSCGGGYVISLLWGMMDQIIPLVIWE